MKYKKHITVTLDDKDLRELPEDEALEEIRKRTCILYLEGEIEILDLKVRNIEHQGCPILDKMSNTKLN